ncbi:hypothetical protein HYFRA_00012199 [Hymenoscyphus fraxineus]|uniref:Uncharacterized protein n=1 Tax=Hymenoscyphus fraxineus TaxID=746836 RepID=A0A9N9L6N2_9HELO|nr:hypothetical protein HYFRA_00012199 [Hymenoscyphus fraxineus]
MQFFSTLILAFSVSAVASTTLTTEQRFSISAMEGIFPRADRVCKPVLAPATCSDSCGAGYITCGDADLCYNPTIGQSCCSDGSHCDQGYSCIGSGGKCLASAVPGPDPASAAQKIEIQMGLMALGGVGMLFAGF